MYDADFKVVAKAVRDRVAAIRRQRHKLRRLAEERRRREEQEEEEGPPSTNVSPTPITGSADSGVSSSHLAEMEEAETGRRHNSLSSLYCECRHLQAVPGELTASTATTTFKNEEFLKPVELASS